MPESESERGIGMKSSKSICDGYDATSLKFESDFRTRLQQQQKHTQEYQVQLQ